MVPENCLVLTFFGWVIYDRAVGTVAVSKPLEEEDTIYLFFCCCCQSWPAGDLTKSFSYFLGLWVVVFFLSLLNFSSNFVTLKAVLIVLLFPLLCRWGFTNNERLPRSVWVHKWRVVSVCCIFWCWCVYWSLKLSWSGSCLYRDSSVFFHSVFKCFWCSLMYSNKRGVVSLDETQMSLL